MRLCAPPYGGGQALPPGRPAHRAFHLSGPGGLAPKPGSPAGIRLYPALDALGPAGAFFAATEKLRPREPFLRGQLATAVSALREQGRLFPRFLLPDRKRKGPVKQSLFLFSRENHSLVISTISSFWGSRSAARQPARALAVSRLVRQAMERSTARRRICTDWRAGSRPLEEVEMI